jgi:hypothetical protein
VRGAAAPRPNGAREGTPSVLSVGRPACRHTHLIVPSYEALKKEATKWNCGGDWREGPSVGLIATYLTRTGHLVDGTIYQLELAAEVRHETHMFTRNARGGAGVCGLQCARRRS